MIFDMDGVIIDSEPMHYKVLTRLLKEEFGCSITDEEYSAFVGTSNAEFWQYLKKKNGLNPEINQLVEVNEQRNYEYLSQSGEQAIPGILELIKDLCKNGVKLAVASSSPHRQIALVMKVCHLEGFFQKIVSGDDVEHGKPAPDVFLLAAEKLGVSPEQCIVVEDSTNGVMAASSAGMKCVGFSNPHSLNQDISQADLRITDFAELDYKRLCKL